MQNADSNTEIDALVSGFFSIFDNRNGRVPELATLLGYFADKAVVARASGRIVQVHTTMEFALPRIDLLAGGALVDFHEFETGATTQVVGGIATRTSRYRKSGVLEGKPFGGIGTKFFQLVATDAGWRILSLAWIDDEV